MSKEKKADPLTPTHTIRIIHNSLRHFNHFLKEKFMFSLIFPVEFDHLQMWRYRIKSSTNQNNDNDNDNNIYEASQKTPRSPSNPDFNHQSLKDIHTLFPHEDNNVSNYENETCSPQNCSSTTPTSANGIKRPSIFHRVHLANRFSRVFTARPKPDPDEYSSGLDKGGVAREYVKSESGTEPVLYHGPASLKPENSEKTEKSLKPYPGISIPGAEKRVVIYITSLRAVRTTFDACQSVRSILQGFRVPVDERDLLMDASFFDEIRKIMAQMGQGKSDAKRVILPKVFIGGRYIGGADEVVELHEIGKLKKLLSGLPEVTPGVCEICGGFRFVLCEECNGSHKCPIDDENGGFRTCTECNENGLTRCPSCLNS